MEADGLEQVGCTTILARERTFAGLLVISVAQLQYKQRFRMTSPIQCDHRKHLKRVKTGHPLSPINIFRRSRPWPEWRAHAN